MSITASDRSDLTDLVCRYALLADDRDLHGVAGLFTTDAELILPDPPADLEPVGIHRGRDEIESALSTLEGIPMTFHAIVGQVFDVGDGSGTATGKVACTAHHLSERAGGEVSDLVWHLRYTDRYQRDAGTWWIARRAVRIHWIETRRARGANLP